MKSNYWEREQINEFIVIARPLLILLICAVHIPYIEGYTHQATPLEAPQVLFGIYIKDVFARSSVPLISIISGYLAYYSYKKHGYSEFFRRKTKTVAIPFLLTNIITLVFFLTAQELTNSIIHATRDVEGFSSMAQAVLGINRLPVNGPLYFLRDLFLISCFIVLVDLTSRSKIATAAVLSYLIYLNSVHPGLIVRFGDAEMMVLYRVDMIIFFLVGYFLSSRNMLPMRTEPYTAFTAILFYLALMLSVTITIAFIKPSPFEYFKGRWAIGIIAFAFLPAFMSISYSLRNTKGYKLLKFLSPYSFMIFLTHIIFTYLYLKAYQHIGLNIVLTSPLHAQLIYFSVYLIGCSLFAIAIRKLLITVRRKLYAKPH